MSIKITVSFGRWNTTEQKNTRADEEVDDDDIFWCLQIEKHKTKCALSHWWMNVWNHSLEISSGVEQFWFLFLHSKWFVANRNFVAFIWVFHALHVRNYFLHNTFTPAQNFLLLLIFFSKFILCNFCKLPIHTHIPIRLKGGRRNYFLVQRLQAAL